MRNSSHMIKEDDYLGTYFLVGGRQRHAVREQCLVRQVHLVLLQEPLPQVGHEAGSGRRAPQPRLSHLAKQRGQSLLGADQRLQRGRVSHQEEYCSCKSMHGMTVCALRI